MTDILQLNLTREQATMIHGAIQLHMFEHHSPPNDPKLVTLVAANIPKWKQQSRLTHTLIVKQNFGLLMREISTFIDGEPPEKCSE